MERCRLCARCSTDTRIPLTADLLEKIRKVLPVVVIVGDPLPQEICEVCEEKVHGMSSFYDETARAASFLRAQLSFVPGKVPPVEDPLLHFHSTHVFFTAAYKSFVKEPDKPKPNHNFIIKRIDKTTFYSCKTCKRTYLSESSALQHSCNMDVKPKSFVSLSSTPTQDSSVLNQSKTCKPKETSQPQVIELSADDLSPEPCRTDVNGNSGTTKSEESVVTWESQRTDDRLGLVIKKKATDPKGRKRKRGRSKETIDFDGDEPVEKQFSCQVCFRVFQFSKELALHSLTHFPNSESPAVADDVPDQITNEPKHMYTCSFCHMSFTRKTTLLKHEQDHLEKSFDVDDWSD